MNMKIQELLGKIFTNIVSDEDEILFINDELGSYKLYHDQHCCERVYVEDIIGDLNDLVGSPILQAEEETSNENPEGVVVEYQESFTWTFYKLATIKGYVTIRWYGESNGYYSESVSLTKINYE